MKIKIGSIFLGCHEIALRIDWMIETQDVIHLKTFFEHWNKQHTHFEKSSTDNLSPGNGVVRSPGDEVITFVLGLDCASSRKTWVNRLYDYKDGRFQEWRKCFLKVLCSWARKNFMVKIFDIGRISVKSGEREVIAQIGSLPIKSGGLECMFWQATKI